MATKEQLKEAIQRALDDDNMEAASELRDRYLALEAQEQPQQVTQPEPVEKPKADIGWLDEFEFAYASSHTDVSNWGLALEAFTPMGEITIGGEDGLISYQSPRELYGDAFVDKMSYDERRDFLLQRREQSVLDEHKDVIIFQEHRTSSCGNCTYSFRTDSEPVV